MSLFAPHRHHAQVAEIPLDRLSAAGIRGILLDLDNTLAHHRSLEVSEANRAWIEGAKDRGFAIYLYSNAQTPRTREMASLLGISAAPRAYKPLNIGLKPALRAMGLAPTQVVLIGDQLFTDVLAGKFGGLMTILIEPLSRREWLHTRGFRRLEYLLGRRAVGKMTTLHRDDPGRD